MLWLDVQDTKFGAKFHIFGHVINDMTNQFIHVSTPAHLSKFDFNRNKISATSYDEGNKHDVGIKSTPINLAGEYTYSGVACIPLDM